MQENKWHNCYDEGWKEIIVPEAFSHPAKMAYGLLKRILAHVKEQGWLKEGDVILDPFGGIGSTGILGAYEGYQCVCCELEQKFVDLAKKNFKLHQDAWVEFGHPFPVILQGDSRQLCQIVEKADCIVSSPPYLETPISHIKEGSIGDRYAKTGEKGVPQQDIGYGQTPGQLGSMKPGKVDAIISSPPFQGAHSGTTDKNSMSPPHDSTDNTCKGYGQTKGNLGNLKPGKVDMVVSSPPYAESLDASPGEKSAFQKTKTGISRPHYSQSSGNLGNLKSGDVDLVLSSPPFEKQRTGGGIAAAQQGKSDYAIANNLKSTGSKNQGYQAQGNSQGQLGQEQGDTFWSAAKLIIDQCYQILKPGGHAIWVVKSFVRNKKIVDFPGDWQRVCEAVGFKTVCVHHAMLVKETKHQTLFGDTEIKRKERKSFFRRLAESKGSPRIDYEVGLCQMKGLCR